MFCKAKLEEKRKKAAGPNTKKKKE